MQRTAAWHRVTARGARSGRDGAGHGRTAPLGPGSGVSVSRKEMCRDQGKILRGSFQIFKYLSFSYLRLGVDGDCSQDSQASWCPGLFRARSCIPHLCLQNNPGTPALPLPSAFLLLSKFLLCAEAVYKRAKTSCVFQGLLSPGRCRRRRAGESACAPGMDCLQLPL